MNFFSLSSPVFPSPYRLFFLLDRYFTLFYTVTVENSFISKIKLAIIRKKTMKRIWNVYKKNSSRLMDQRSPLDQIIQDLRRMMPELTSNYGVQTLGLLGSFAHGAQNQRSDLDLLVDFKRVPTLFQFIRLEKDLKEKLGIKVDLVMKTALKPNIGRQILREVIPI
jgi:uncharacterized protein